MTIHTFWVWLVVMVVLAVVLVVMVVVVNEAVVVVVIEVACMVAAVFLWSWWLCFWTSTTIAFGCGHVHSLRL